MDLAELQRKLIAAARANPPGERVPLAFEKRVLARLGARPVPDLCSLWARALWRAATPCVALMLLLLGAWLCSAPTANPPPNDLTQDLENTLLAAAEPEPAPDSSW
jgi:hypothetical protein